MQGRRDSGLSLVVHVCGVAVVLSALTQPLFAQNQPTTAREESRVRSSSAAVRLLMQQTADRSATFRSLVSRIDATNGLVYVEEAKCPYGAKACLYHQLQLSGPNRVLHIGLAVTRRDPISVAASIGHELQHAVEVLERRDVTTVEDMVGVWVSGLKMTTERYETTDAIEAGIRVHEELVRTRDAH